MEEGTRKIFKSLAENLVRNHLLSLSQNKPSDYQVMLGVNRVMKEIERQHGSVTKAALNSPTVSLKPIVDEIIAKFKW
jgi:hypothetical protein